MNAYKLFYRLRAFWNALKHLTALEQENAALRGELAQFRRSPEPIGPSDAPPAVTEAMQQKLSNQAWPILRAKAEAEGYRLSALRKKENQERKHANS